LLLCCFSSSVEQTAGEADANSELQRYHAELRDTAQLSVDYSLKFWMDSGSFPTWTGSPGSSSLTGLRGRGEAVLSVWSADGKEAQLNKSDPLHWTRVS